MSEGKLNPQEAIAISSLKTQAYCTKTQNKKNISLENQVLVISKNWL